MQPRLRLRRRSLFFAPFLVCAAFLGIAALRSRSQTVESDTTREIARGLSLRSVQTQTPQGPLRYWLVKAAPDKFDLGLQIPDETDAQKKRSVRALAAQSGALVAVNGGFFAYGGAAVGAVKSNGMWQRTPWMRRTAIGWSTAQDARIGPVQGGCTLTIRSKDGQAQLAGATFNGFTFEAKENSANTNGFAVLTPMFARTYMLKPGEIAFGQYVDYDGLDAPPPALIQSTGSVDLQTYMFVVIARGEAAKRIDLQKLPRFSFGVGTTPYDWNFYENILGAGPRLVKDGLALTTAAPGAEENFLPDVLVRGPRTCVGWDKDRNWLFFVADGRSPTSVGLTLPETAQLFQRLGAVEAMNLDGGSSTQLVVNGELTNTPSGFDPVNPLRPREVQVINALVLKARGK